MNHCYREIQHQIELLEKTSSHMSKPFSIRNSVELNFNFHHVQWKSSSATNVRQIQIQAYFDKNE